MSQFLKPRATSSLSTPLETYIYSLAHCTPSTLAAISSDDSLRVFDSTTLQATNVFPNVNVGVTSLCQTSPHTLATAGRDGVVRAWDSRTKPSKPSGEWRAGNPILSLAAEPRGRIAVGTENAQVMLWEGGSEKLLRKYTESHNDEVTEMRFHSAGYLLSAGEDGLVNVFDLTAPAGGHGVADDEVEGAVRRVVNHGSAVHKAGFLDKEVWAVSCDEVLGVYSLDEAVEEEGRNFGDVRGVLGCEYVVDILPREDGGGWVASGNHSQGWLELRPLVQSGAGIQGWDVAAEGGFRLEGGHGEEVVRGVLVDAGTKSVITGGEDGTVKAWEVQLEGTRSEQKSKKRGKKEDEAGSERKRYKPY